LVGLAVSGLFARLAPGALLAQLSEAEAEAEEEEARGDVDVTSS
jgi:hypothetical protein